MRVWDSEAETIRRWYCDHCGKRYDAPGVCTDGHADTPVALQEVDDPVNTSENEAPVELTEEEKQNAIQEQGKDVTISNQSAQIKQLESQLASATQYINELEAKLNPPTEAGQ